MCAALVVALAGAACADEAADAGKKALADVASMEGRLLGRTTMGFYFGSKRIGGIDMNVEKAPADSGAAYKQTVVMTFAFGPQKSKNTIELLVDAKLALVYSKKTEVEEKAGAKTTTVKETKREGDKYVRTVTKDGGEPTTMEAPAGEGDYEECLTMVAQIVGTQPGKYAFKGLKWPATPEGKATWQDLTVEVAAAADHEHRGKTVKAHISKGSKGGKEPMKLIVSAEGKLLEMAPEGAPVRMISGTAEEAAADLPKPADEGGAKEAAGNGAGTPMAAVEVYFKVLSSQLKIDDLDRVMDWKHMFDLEAKENPQVADLGVEQWAKIVKDQIGARLPAIPAEQANLVLTMLKAKENGDTAEVELPGQSKTFKLVKTSDGWKIREFPR